MRRNPFQAVFNEARAIARREMMTPAQQAAPVVGAPSGVVAGGADTTTGDIVAYGLFDITPFSGFRLG
jgi:hypothetical protein